MYHLGRRQAHHYILYASIGLAICGVLLAGSWTLHALLQPHTILKQSKSITHTVTAGGAPSRQISKSVFTLRLPSDWHATKSPSFTYTAFSWSGSGLVGSARHLDVYVDHLPPNFAVNRLLPVRAAGSGLDVTGTVSDNCVNFTDKTAQSTASGHAMSKWGGVNFLCDMGNYERDVVAIGSSEGLNQVTLMGSTTGRHMVLLVYADNNINPDYTTFVTIVKSFHLL